MDRWHSISIVEAASVTVVTVNWRLVQRIAARAARSRVTAKGEHKIEAYN